MDKVKVQHNCKDSFFRMLFKDKENLLNLYNTLNGTNYTDACRTLKEYEMYVERVRTYAK